MEIGRTFIDDNSFYNGISTESGYNSLINTDRHSNAIDIYFLSPTDSYARASGIPGDALAFGGNYAKTSVLSHEIGHCLGLYHTHSGSGCNDYVNCAENIDGSKCSTCGDLVCDTPADPCLSGKVDNSCNYTGGGGYSPDTDNIMSYASPVCLDDLTNGQMSRLHNIITNSSLLQSLSYLLEISGTSTVCTSNITFTLHNRPPGSTVSWTRSNSLTYVSGQGTNNYTVKANSGSTNGIAWVQANVNGTIIKKTVRVGVPVTPVISCYHNTVGMNSQVEAFVSSSGADNYTWHIGGGTVESGQGTSEILIRTSSHCLYDLTIRVTTSNSCGNSAQAMKSIPFDCSGGPSPLIVSPNPAKETLTVEIKDVEMRTISEVDNKEYAVKLYNSNQVPVYVNKVRTKRFTINISSFPFGIYYLQVTKSKSIYSKIVIISD